MQDGMSTRVSRGMETRSIRFRSAEMCTTIVVSDRMPSSSPPSRAFSPSQTSEAISRWFSARPSFGSVGSGVSVTTGSGMPRIRAEMSCVSMLLSRRARVDAGARQGPCAGSMVLAPPVGLDRLLGLVWTRRPASE